MVTTGTVIETVTEDVHTDDAKGYARTIQRGLTPRERRALAAVYEEMPCSVAAVARHAEVSRRTAQRACDALEGDQLQLVQRVNAGLIVHPDAIGAVDAWAHRHGGRSGITAWWEDPAPGVDRGGRFDPDTEDWPDDVFPEPAFEVMPEASLELALRAVDARRAPLRKGTFVPFAVLDYVAATGSLQAAKVALECGRRADRNGVATFGRGELAKAVGLTGQQVTNALAKMRQDGIAPSATAIRVGLDLKGGQGGHPPR